MTSKRISFEIIKKSFLPVLILALFFSGYIFYRTNVLPVISDELAQIRLRGKIRLFSDEARKVLDIGMQRSKFLSEDKTIIALSNLDLSKSKILNYTYGEERLSKL